MPSEHRKADEAKVQRVVGELYPVKHPTSVREESIPRDISNSGYSRFNRQSPHSQPPSLTVKLAKGCVLATGGPLIAIGLFNASFIVAEWAETIFGPRRHWNQSWIEFTACLLIAAPIASIIYTIYRAITHARKQAKREYQEELFAHLGFGTEAYFARYYNWQFAVRLDGFEDHILDQEIRRLVGAAATQHPLPLDREIQELWKLASVAFKERFEEKQGERFQSDNRPEQSHLRERH